MLSKNLSLVYSSQGGFSECQRDLKKKKENAVKLVSICISFNIVIGQFLKKEKGESNACQASSLLALKSTVNL